ncbi:transcriptional regulatory [Fusarium longipes]|uniref:Transcriptional regulatory n=1 Tax=Fusarium longipes TaxID=694270 RepID=A0A395SW58_9HYPO|nr:transcriptional regulatory [Fusarium longipes]
MGDRHAALQHLSNGIQLLTSVAKSQVEIEKQEIKGLKPIFERLDMQASFFQDDRIPVLSLPDWNIHRGDYSAMVTEKGFATIQQAHESLVRLQSWFYRFVNKNVDLHEASTDLLGSAVLEEKAALVQGYTSWIDAFENFRLTENHDDQAMYGLKTLLVQFYICRMLLDSKFPADEKIFGVSPNPAAHQILDLAETLLDYTTKVNSSPNATQTPRRNFSLESGVVAPLFALALKCSDESVVTRAAEMLSLSQRREGLYDAQTMAQILAHLRRSRDGKMDAEISVNGGGIPMGALEYYIPRSYEGGGIDKLLAAMTI